MAVLLTRAIAVPVWLVACATVVLLAPAGATSRILLFIVLGLAASALLAVASTIRRKAFRTSPEHLPRVHVLAPLEVAPVTAIHPAPAIACMDTTRGKRPPLFAPIPRRPLAVVVRAGVRVTTAGGSTTTVEMRNRAASDADDIRRLDSDMG